MTRLAIAGLGAVTRNVHLPAYQQLGAKISLVGGCDIQREARSYVAKLLPSVLLFSDFDEMLRATQPEMVSICTPPFLHHRQCLAALEHG